MFNILTLERPIEGRQGYTRLQGAGGTRGAEVQGTRPVRVAGVRGAWCPEISRIRTSSLLIKQSSKIGTNFYQFVVTSTSLLTFIFNLILVNIRCLIKTHWNDSVGKTYQTRFLQVNLHLSQQLLVINKSLLLHTLNLFKKNWFKNILCNDQFT